MLQLGNAGTHISATFVTLGLTFISKECLKETPHTYKLNGFHNERLFDVSSGIENVFVLEWQLARPAQS